MAAAATLAKDFRRLFPLPPPSSSSSSSRDQTMHPPLFHSKFHGLATGHRLCFAITLVVFLIPIAFYVMPIVVFSRGSDDGYRQVEILAWYKNQSIGKGEIAPNKNQRISTEEVISNNKTQDVVRKPDSGAELVPPDNKTPNSSTEMVIPPENQTPIVVEKLDSGTEAFWKRLVQEPRVVRCADFGCSTELPLPGRNPTGPNSTSEVCPDYFKWIREDLAPWEKSGGITREAVEQAMKSASFRAVIVGGKLYVEPFVASFQTRGLFTLWGILQLLRHYPGQVPDVELAFNCDDRPIFARPQPSKIVVPPPIIFRYCSTPRFLDIPLPDWSFWGWPEISLRRWDLELADILEGSKAVAWPNRTNAAYWKGNPIVAQLRMELLKCNSSDFNAQIFIQDWIAEGQKNYAHSKLSEQCRHRYKIYAEGWGWSASLKYILACDSPVLMIDPEYHDFFIRGLRPKVSYWPVMREEMCKSIKFSVDWGNSHPTEVERMGKSGQDFTSNDLDMGYVYDYMLHMLTEYAKLQRFKPTIPKKGAELCINSVLCLASNLEKPFLEQSLLKNPSTRVPCRLPSDSDGPSVKQMLSEKASVVASIHREEREAWKNTAS